MVTENYRPVKLSHTQWITYYHSHHSQWHTTIDPLHFPLRWQASKLKISLQSYLKPFLHAAKHTYIHWKQGPSICMYALLRGFDINIASQ
jgi:hypothetical protein